MIADEPRCECGAPWGTHARWCSKAACTFELRITAEHPDNPLGVDFDVVCTRPPGHEGRHFGFMRQVPAYSVEWPLDG